MFESIFSNDAVTTTNFFICMIVALISGIIFASICSINTKSSKSFLITSAMLPMVVTMVIALVNGNVGIGVAIAGAFSLVRFRSATGTAKEICIIFIAMASGLAFGIGYIAYGIIFLFISSILIVLLEKIKIWDKKNSQEKILRITIPENLDYTEIFDKIFNTYLSKNDLIKVKTTNMGSMFKLYYRIQLKDNNLEKELIDEIRVKNGNFEVQINRTNFDEKDL